MIAVSRHDHDDQPERLTRERITEQFGPGWVLMVDCEHDDDGYIVAGRVLWHSQVRDEVYRKIGDLNLKESAVLFVGDRPANLSYVL